MNKRQAQRLLRMVQALQESPTPEAFCMDTYVHDENTAYMLPDSVPESADFCGAPACNLGHYGGRRDLQRLMRIGQHTVSGGMGLFYGNNKTAEYLDPAILEHFGVDEDQAEDLFGLDGCNGAQTPDESAQYIKKFVRKHYGTI